MYKYNINMYICVCIYVYKHKILYYYVISYCIILNFIPATYTGGGEGAG